MEYSLGPIFFLRFIDDLKRAVNGNPRLFADNTCLTVRAPSVPVLEGKIYDNLNRLHEYCVYIN